MSDEIVSLFTLMDSHLSRTRLDEISSENNETRPAVSTSNNLLPSPPGTRLNIPKYFSGNSPIKDLLANQISNTLKAKLKQTQEVEELKKKEEELLQIKNKEKLRLEEEMRKLKLQEEEEYIIDLTAAIIPQTKVTPSAPKPQIENKKPEENARSKIGIGVKTCLHFDKETCKFKPWNPMLPCSTDISYILINEKQKNKCSKLGKVLCSRKNRIYGISIPITIQKVDTSNVKIFDFKTKSPADLHKEYLEDQRKPKMSTRFTVDIMDFI